MKSRIIVSVTIGCMFLWSCGNKSRSIDQANEGNTVIQQEDGSLVLNIDKAACYNDISNPASNTAEWKVVIAKPGRFKVWLTSATRDTTDLSYVNSVKVTFLDSFLEVDPVCDKVVKNSEDISYPYYRADSYLGSFYVLEAGAYNLQVISEKVLPREAMNQHSGFTEDTRLMSLLLTPMTR
ncbi:MAG TPA: hypothetical protein PLS58_10175 [Bacteroidales bacterium]|jgi:hypothetical protein|nr:hypothetical protein [Bacteroidales bacterium]